MRNLTAYVLVGVTVAVAVPVAVVGLHPKPVEKKVAQLTSAEIAADDARRARVDAEKASAWAQTPLVKSDGLIESEADMAQAKREREIRRHFPARPNAIHNCALGKGRPLRGDFSFGSEESVAYRLQLRDSALAQRFIVYLDAAASCTPYTRSVLARALIPMLPYVRNTADLGTVIAVAGDIGARDADNTPARFAATVRELARVMKQ